MSLTVRAATWKHRRRVDADHSPKDRLDMALAGPRQPREESGLGPELQQSSHQSQLRKQLFIQQLLPTPPSRRPHQGRLS